MPTLSLPSLPVRSSTLARARSKGQVVVIFALSITLFVALCAVVVDVAFYWVSTLRVQRAADAAALAGAVYLPGDTTTAYSEAKASATQNGYTTGGTGVNNVVVTPVQDGGDPRQLDVTISANVPTFFARVIGITSWSVTKSSKGVYVLPVPMGSPLAYYGVGDYSVNQVTPNPPTLYQQASVPGYTSNPTSGKWSNPDRGWATGTSNFTTSSTNNQVQGWTGLKIPAISGAVLDGLVLSFNAKVGTAATACKVKAEVSWDGGGATWNSTPLTSNNLTTANNVNYTLGSASDLSVWGTTRPSAAADFGNTKFQVRLTYLKGTSCGNLSLNTLVATVYSHTDNPPTVSVVTTAGVKDGATTLASQGAWGAILTKGGNEENGDAYSPANNGASANAKYDAGGYNYALQLPSGGAVKVFDPGFCAMGSNGAGGSMGAGDHWIGSSGTPVSTYYTIWNANGKLGLPGYWTQVYTSGSLFEGQTGFDPANTAPGVASGSGPGGATSGCDTYHNAWWTVPTGSLPGGTYVLQVQTSKTSPPAGTADASVNSGTNAENMWSIEITGAGAQVYGNGRMAVYNNLQGAGTQGFYLAKIDQATGAGKTALIDLFDPGDLASGSTGTLQVLSPDGGSPHVVNFSYTTDANCKVVSGASPCSGTNVSQITTTSTSGQATNNTWIHISIPLPNTYGSTATGGLWNNGWWQIQYIVSTGGNDTTTWQVSVSGNPVHLLVP